MDSLAVEIVGAVELIVLVANFKIYFRKSFFRKLVSFLASNKKKTYIIIILGGFGFNMDGVSKSIIAYQLFGKM